jgi:hypothetical protein
LMTTRDEAMDKMPRDCYGHGRWDQTMSTSDVLSH